MALDQLGKSISVLCFCVTTSACISNEISVIDRERLDGAYREAGKCSNERLEIYSVQTNESADVVANASFEFCKKLWENANDVYVNINKPFNWDKGRFMFELKKRYNFSSAPRVLEIRAAINQPRQ